MNLRWPPTLMGLTVLTAMSYARGRPYAQDAGAAPRLGAGPSFALMQVAGGSGQRDEALALGAAGSWRPRRHLSLLVRYTRAAIDHDYAQLRFHSAYHRMTLAPEARLPIGARFDFIALVGPEFVLLRSQIWDRSAGHQSRSRRYLGLSLGAGMAYRVGSIELRADALVTARDRRSDLGVFAAALYTWQ